MRTTKRGNLNLPAYNPHNKKELNRWKKEMLAAIEHAKTTPSFKLKLTEKAKKVLGL